MRRNSQSNLRVRITVRPETLAVLRGNIAIPCPCTRPPPRRLRYGSTEPATGEVIFKSVDNSQSTCTPGPHDDVGQAVFQCWQHFMIAVNGCQVRLVTDVASRQCSQAGCGGTAAARAHMLPECEALTGRTVHNGSRQPGSDP